MSFRETFNKKELKFTDRDEIISIFKTLYENMMREKPFFHIISISGMGGIGKSRLLKELKLILKEYQDPYQEILYLTLEITGSNYYLNALAKLRSQINKVCPLFDYAFLTYWKRTHIEKLDESFLNVFKHQWYNELKEPSKLLGGIISIPFNMVNISVDIILEILEKSFDLIKQKYYINFFEKHSKNISEYTADNLKDLLAGFLGMDINRIFCEKNLCIFIDAYERYPTDNSYDWLMDLMSEAYTGLFVISGREKISFPDDIKKKYYQIH